VVATAERLVRDHADIGAVVLECTNLAPFTYDIAKRLRVPVYDTVSMVNLFHAGLRPQRYEND
jgi:Asp/Glu/hydantoin racemase